MHLSILPSLLLTIAFTAAIPFKLDWTEAEKNYKTLSAEDKAKHDVHKAQVEAAHAVANERILAMHAALHEPDINKHKDYIETAFGKVDDEKLAKIKQNVARMRDGTIRMTSALPNKNFPHIAQSVKEFHGNKVKVEEGRVSYSHVELGDKFFGSHIDDQAKALVHEAAHVLAGASDHVVGPPGTEGSLRDAVVKGVPSIQIDNPNHGLGNNPKLWRGLGYGMIPDESRSGRGKLLTHAQIINDDGASLTRSNFDHVRKYVSHMDRNADSYAILSSLCARSLYKRALTQKNPLGYYLAKRARCKPSPEAAKAARQRHGAGEFVGKTIAASKARDQHDAFNRAREERAAANTAQQERTTAKNTKEPEEAQKKPSLWGRVFGKQPKPLKSTEPTNGRNTAEGEQGTQATVALKGANLKKTRSKAEVERGTRATGMGANAAEGATSTSHCPRSLYKRALVQDDPVGYYLAKRDRCFLPSANTSKALQKATDSKNVQHTGGVPPAKAIKLLGAENGPRATKAAKRLQPAKAAKTTKTLTANGIKTAKRVGAAKGHKTPNTTKGSKAGKGSNVAKGRKGAKATKGHRRAKVVKATKLNKGARAAKGSKGAKGAKANRKALAKGAKGTKGAKVAKGLNAKGAKAAKSKKDSKVAKGSKGAKSNRKAVAKGAKGPKGAKGKKGLKTKGAKAAKGKKVHKALKASKGSKGAKNSKGSKGAKGEVAKRRKVAKGTKAGKGLKAAKGTKVGGSKAAKGGRAGKGAKPSNRTKGNRASKGSKATNSRKAGRTPKAAKAVKSKKPKATKGKNHNSRSKAPKPSNRAGGRGTKGRTSKVAAIPQVQQRVPKATPAAKFAARKKAGKRH